MRCFFFFMLSETVIFINGFLFRFIGILSHSKIMIINKTCITKGFCKQIPLVSIRIYTEFVSLFCHYFSP